MKYKSIKQKIQQASQELTDINCKISAVNNKTIAIDRKLEEYDYLCKIKYLEDEFNLMQQKLDSLISHLKIEMFINPVYGVKQKDEENK